MNTPNTTTIALAFTTALGAFGAAQAATNPFGLAELDGGYVQLAEASADTKASAEGKCGEGKFGGSKPDKAGAEGKCGEGKCGGSR